MQFLIVTGLSGAGKSRAVVALEDIGFYCVDNMPPELIPKFAEVCSQGHGKMDKIALVADVRSGDMFHALSAGLQGLKEHGIDYKILFLSASETVLIRRFKETRRRHPLMDSMYCSLEQAIQKEREMLKAVKMSADYVIDTSLLSVSQLKERIVNLFLENTRDSLYINCMSFGFKYGIPPDADLVFDVRCLPNPFYIPELKGKTGLDKEVKDYVLSFEQSNELIARLNDLIDFLVPLYVKEGKSQLVVAIGCTGGKHRSILFAELLNEHLIKMGNNSRATHRDKGKE